MIEVSVSIGRKEMMIDKLLGMIFPGELHCLCCGSILGSRRRYPICDDCIGKFGWVTESTCRICGKPLAKVNEKRGICYDCSESERTFDKGYTCALYGLYERALIMDLKYRDKSYIARALGLIMADRVLAEDEGGAGPAWDFVTWVPVSKKRLDQRGYDQAELLAGFFAEALSEGRGRSGLDAPALKGLLERAKDTAPMKDLGIAERRENVKNAFKMKRNAVVKEKSVLVIDDVFTTGATLEACARALKEAGAAGVDVLTFASGGDHRGRSEDREE